MKDKILHFAAGLMIGILFGGLAVIVGFAVAAAAGAIKELVWDLYLERGTVEYWDFVCTCIGGAFGVLPWVITGGSLWTFT